MAGRVTSPIVIGRREELASIAAAVAAAKSGKAQVVLVSGDAGIGKTRLVTEACTRAERDGVLTAVGGCVQLGESSLAYAPLIEALRGVRRRLGDEEFTGLLGPAAASVGALLGLVDGSDGHPSQIFEQLLGMLGRLGERQPTVLVFEDLHWADASTRDLVAFLGRNLRDASLVLVLTYRSDELHRRHPWLPVLADLQRDPQVERITVTGLTREELAVLLERIGVAHRTLDDLQRRTDGNPFYIEELVAAGELSGAVPPTLAGVILARVHGLPEPTPAVLHHAAVLGELIDDQRLAELTSQPLSIISEALHAAVSHHILVADGVGCRFRHALVREALYDDLIPGERERLHAAVARLLQDRPPNIPENVLQTQLAYHAHAAGDLPTAFAASVRAGAECERVYVLADAAVQYERALALWDQVSDPDTTAAMTRSELLLRAANAVADSSLSPRAITLAEAALAALPDDASPEQQVTVLERIARFNLLSLQGPAAAVARDRAVALVADRPPSPEKAVALAGYAANLGWRDRWREAEPVLREAIAVAEQVDATAVRAHVLCSLGTTLINLGRPDEAISAGQQALELSREYSTTEHVCRAYVSLSDSLYACGRYDEAETVAAAGLAYAEQTGYRGYYRAVINEHRIWIMFCAGRWDNAEQAETQFIDRMPEAGGWFTGGWLCVLVGQGRAQEAKSMIDELLAAPPGAGDAFRAGTLILAGELAELEARWDQARDLLDQGLALARGTDEPLDSSRGYASAIRVERRRIESLAGQRAAAEEIEHALQVADQRIGQARDLAARLDAAGISLLPEPAAWLRSAEAEHAAIHRRDTAQTWADLADIWHTVGQPYPQAVPEYRYADALLRQHGDRDHARRAAADALEVAERLGAAPLAAEIRQLGQRGRLDLTPPPQPQPGATPATVDRLNVTPREAEVLALLAAGRTNREIARTLFISDKTASVHVSNLLRKLGAANRAEAAAIAQHVQVRDEQKAQAPGAAD